MTGAPTYAVDVRSIIEDLGETIEIDGDIDLPVLALSTEEFRPLAPGHVDLSITNTGAGIVASGTVQVELEAVCARCLVLFPLTVTAQVEGFYIAPGHEREMPEEQEYGFITEGRIDLMEQILAALALELPFAPLHAEDCAGICPTCGADLSEGACGCAADRADSPFAALRDLLPPDGDA